MKTSLTVSVGGAGLGAWAKERAGPATIKMAVRKNADNKYALIKRQMPFLIFKIIPRSSKP
jgi:hypothetical protein